MRRPSIPLRLRSLAGGFAALGLFVLASPAWLAGAPRSAAVPLFRDPSQPLETRVRDLISRLTLKEKAAFMENMSTGVPRLGIPPYNWWSEALHGVAWAGRATVFPQAIALAATWDDGFMRKVSGVIGVEARAKYNEAIARGEHGQYQGLTFWSPNVNIFRDPRWGRGQETYGEDPYLTSRMGVAFVEGLQGDNPRYLLAAACAKHFAVHSGPEPLRHVFNVDPLPADLYETYLPAFEALVREGHVEAVMTAYNALYGEPCAANPLLYDLLYRQWGFQGHVVSDCGAIEDIYTSRKLAKDAAEAEAMAVNAGLCLTCGHESPAIVEAVKRGLIDRRTLDARLYRLLRTLFRLGLFDPKGDVPFNAISPAQNDTPAHAALALEAARKGIVLLKNDGLLPLRAGGLRRVAVVGPNAASVDALLGNYNGTPSAPVTVLAGLKAALGPGVRVDYVPGCAYVDPLPGRSPVGTRFALDAGPAEA
ncbi:MAG: glycoside hydrolase family 3 protein, partial [Opitutaceae bacterium]